MDDPLAQALTPTTALLWRQYLLAESQGQRARTLTALRAFVGALQADSEEQRRQFAEAFSRRMADDGDALPLREPLFAGIIGPYLVSAYQKGEPNARRWLAYFHLQFLNMPPSAGLLGLSSLSPIDLLSEAFRHDPEDTRTQDLLIEKMAQQFDYAVHEVPSGVLNGAKGATVAECQEWENDLALFREVVQKRRIVEKYEVAMRYWGFHFHGYADYLTHQEDYQSYADYVKRHWDA